MEAACPKLELELHWEHDWYLDRHFFDDSRGCFPPAGPRTYQYGHTQSRPYLFPGDHPLLFSPCCAGLAAVVRITPDVCCISVQQV